MENKYLVAETYRNFKQVGEPKELNGKLRIKVIYSCDRCGGTGFYGRFGTCFKCNGAGKLGDWVRVYTEEEFAKYENQKAKAQEKRDIEKQKYFEQKYNEWFSKNGFNEDGITYIVCGGDTFQIKDQLKELGFKFNPILKWHCADAEVVLPDGYQLAALSYENCYSWNGRDMLPVDGAEDYVKNIERKYLPEEEISNSEFVGSLGERLKKVPAVLKNHREIMGNYGSFMLYTFDIEGNTLVWITNSTTDVEDGSNIILSATVKEHKEYRGVKQTVLSRCIIKQA